MQFSSVIRILGFVGVASCLPTTTSPEPSTDSNELSLVQDALANFTYDSASLEVDFSMFGLLPDDTSAFGDHVVDGHHVEARVDGHHIEARGGPPRDRKVAEQMKSLPECFQTCFRNENGKVGVDIYNWDLNTFCYMPKWIQTNAWFQYHIRPCWKWQCRDHMKEIQWAGKHWIDETCP